MSGTILIVDDDERNRRLLNAILTPEKYHLFEAISGEECLEILGREEVHLVLLDVMMPGISGFETLERIRGDEKTKTVPVILVTALQAREDRIKGIELGADDFISKPIDAGELLARVRTYIRLNFLRRQLDEKEKLGKVIDQVQEGVIITGENFAPLTVNGSAGLLLEMEGEPTNILAWLEEKYAVSIDPGDFSREYVLERPETENHQPLYLSLMMKPVKNQEGKIESFIFFISDITEKHLEDRLRQDFLSLISHKLMTPITVTDSIVTVLRTSVTGEKEASLLGNLAREQGKLVNLVKRLLYFIETTGVDLSGKTDADAIGEILAETAARYPGTKATVEKEVSVGEIPVYAKIMLAELADNAFKFNDKDQLDLRVEVTPAFLRVSDNGPGIPPEERERIFEAFYQIEKDFTGNVPGAGLGLTLIRKLVGLHAAKIEIESTLGGGTTVIVHIG